METRGGGHKAIEKQYSSERQGTQGRPMPGAGEAGLQMGKAGAAYTAGEKERFRMATGPGHRTRDPLGEPMMAGSGTRS